MENPGRTPSGFFSCLAIRSPGCPAPKRYLAAELRRDHRRRDTRGKMIFLKVLFTQLIGSCTVFLKVADEMVSRQPVLRRQHFLFAKPPKNHRQCPAGGFSFLGRADHIAARAPRGGSSAADSDGKSLHKVTVHGKGWRNPLFLLLLSLLRRGNPLCSSSLQAQKRFSWGQLVRRVPRGRPAITEKPCLILRLLEAGRGA